MLQVYLIQQFFFVVPEVVIDPLSTFTPFKTRSSPDPSCTGLRGRPSYRPSWRQETSAMPQAYPLHLH